MAKSRSDGGRAGYTGGGGNAAGQHLPALRLRPMGEAMAEAPRAWGHHRRRLRAPGRCRAVLGGHAGASGGVCLDPRVKPVGMRCTRERRGSSSSDAMRRRTGGHAVSESRRRSTFLASRTSVGTAGGEGSNSGGSLAATGCAPGCRWSKRSCAEGCTRRSMSRGRGYGG